MSPSAASKVLYWGMTGHPNFTKCCACGVGVAVCGSVVILDVAGEFELSAGSARLGRTNVPTERPLMRPARAKREMAKRVIVRDCEFKVFGACCLDNDDILNGLFPDTFLHLSSPIIT